MNLPSIILWKQSFSVGVASVDADHKKLIEMINRLFGAPLSSEPNQVLDNILRELTEYVVFHFNREEAYMDSLNYPEYETHKKSHQKLLDAARKFKKNLDSGLATNLEKDVEKLLRDWLVNHIQSNDKHLGRFLNEQGIQ